LNIAEALQLSILLLQKIAAARAAGLTTIEIDDIGKDFKVVVDAIEAARGISPE
jgi:hypothetical protein